MAERRQLDVAGVGHRAGVKGGDLVVVLVCGVRLLSGYVNPAMGRGARKDYCHRTTEPEARRAPTRQKKIGPGRFAGADHEVAQLNESPQAQEPVAFGLSMVKPCFSMVS